MLKRHTRCETTTSRPWRWAVLRTIGWIYDETAANTRGFTSALTGRIDLRETVNAATCKSEEFNNFLKWVFFYNNGIIQENFRHEQAKIVKYNHLVANLIILHNVNSMTKGIRKLQREGVEVSPEMLDGFSPYGTSHLNLLGQFDLNTRRTPKSRTFRLNA